MNDAVRAKKIADLIAGCNTDHRGDLLQMVAEDLRMQTQWFTATCIDAAASAYRGEPRLYGRGAQP